MLVSEIPIIDVDTHVVEPPDLWTSRMSTERWGDQVPHVRWDPTASEEAWFSGSMRLGPVVGAAMAGWHEHPPYHPPTWAEADPVAWNATKRLELMDTYGIQSQVLYPNVAVFDARSILQMNDPELQLGCIRAYNDFLIEWGSVAPERYIAMASLPFWSLEETLAEIERSPTTRCVPGRERSERVLMSVLLSHEFAASLLVRASATQVMGTILYDYYNNGTYSLVAAMALIMTAVTAIGVTLAVLIGGSDALGGL